MFSIKKSRISIVAGMVSLGMLLLALSISTEAEETAAQKNQPAARKAAFIPPDNAASRSPSLEGIARGAPAGSDNVLVFSAPPREANEDSIRIYQPIAEYLSRVTGKTIVYQRPGDWIAYQMEMLRGSYDIIFDEAHLNSWRISNLRHTVLVKIADQHAYAIVVHKDNTTISNIKHLAGQTVCAMNPPNLGTLTLLNMFDNPVRQPMIVNSESWSKAYDGVVTGKKCEAAIVPVAILEKLSGSDNSVHVIYKTKMLPNQAFSAGPRVSSIDQAKISAALLSREGIAATTQLMSAYASIRGLVYANNKDYAGLDVYLKDTWGYAR